MTSTPLTGLEAGGGCAAKYSAALLEELLAGFTPASSERLLVGLETADDAAVYLLDDERALVLTIDFFPPMLDDPAVFGSIAAANALNDVFAMGGRPLVALSVAAFPEELDPDAVRTILNAAAETVQRAGALLAGGHTIRDDEPKYGLAVAGTVHPNGIWRKNGAVPGDSLYLTKPLGTGLVLTGHRKGLLTEPDYAAATTLMTELNDRAAELLRPFQPHAVTDVTGFGLFGHSHEVASRSGVRIVIEADRLPWLQGAMEAAEAGIRTGGDGRNRDFVGDALEVAGQPEYVAALGFDPQTSGGLLISIPSEKRAVLEAEADAAGLRIYRIGSVEQGSGLLVR